MFMWSLGPYIYLRFCGKADEARHMPKQPSQEYDPELLREAACTQASDHIVTPSKPVVAAIGCRSFGVLCLQNSIVFEARKLSRYRLPRSWQF